MQHKNILVNLDNPINTFVKDNYDSLLNIYGLKIEKDFFESLKINDGNIHEMIDKVSFSDVQEKYKENSLIRKTEGLFYRIRKGSIFGLDFPESSEVILGLSPYVILNLAEPFLIHNVPEMGMVLTDKGESLVRDYDNYKNKSKIEGEPIYEVTKSNKNVLSDFKDYLCDRGVHVSLDELKDKRVSPQEIKEVRESYLIFADSIIKSKKI